MASYTENIQSQINLNNTFQRVFAQPIDRSSLFSSYQDACDYAQGDGRDTRKLGGTAYVGQIITVYENDEISVYKITPNKTIKRIDIPFTSDSNGNFTLDGGEF